MLRITQHSNGEFLTFQLEGRLAGPWVRELVNCWEKAPVEAERASVRFDLTAVTFIDAAGVAFLAAQYAQGAELIASGCLMRAVVAEITQASVPSTPVVRSPDSRVGIRGCSNHEGQTPGKGK
jgi:anti-anti-sigma regulatory factor